MRKGIYGITSIHRVLACLLFTVLPVLPVSASIVTETPDDLYAMDETELFQLLQQQNMVLNGFNLDNLVIPAPILETVGDKAALDFVGQLLAQNDPRGPTALANYLTRYPNDFLALYLAASELIEQGKYREAELTLSKILQSQPDFHSAVNLIGLIRVEQNQYQIASQIFARVLFRDPKPNGMAARYMAWLGLRSGNVAQAETALAMTIAKMPSGKGVMSPIILELAELYRRQQKFTEIVALLDNYQLGDSPDQMQIEALSRRFEAATQVGEVAIAERDLSLLKQLNADSTYPALLGTARLLAQKNQFADALSTIERAKGEAQSLEQVRLVEKAKIEAVAQDFNAAVQTLGDFLAMAQEENPQAWQQYIDMMILIGQGNTGIQRLEQAIQTEPNVSLQMLLVDTLMKAGDLNSANRLLNQILSENPNTAVAHFTKGVLQFDAGENDAAAESFKMVVELEPQNIPGWLALFGALHDHREHQHAAGMASTEHADLMPFFDQAIAANPGSVTLLYEKGLTAYSGSELAVAKQAFDQVVASAPLDVPGAAMAAIVRADENTQPEAALALAQRGFALDPENPAVIDALGWALVQSGQVAEGMNYLNRALQLMPGDEAVLAHLAEAHLKQGNIEQGLNYVYDALVGILPDHTQDALRANLIKHKPLEKLDITVNFINAFGVGELAGTISISAHQEGVVVDADVTGLPSGLNGMHFHEKPSCEAGMQNGERVAGMGAGGHYGHGHHMMDMGDMDMSNMSHEEHMMHMQMMKPKGDLPPLPVDESGSATDVVIGANLTIDELRGRSLIIHQGPDVDGQSGPKVACAVIP